MRPVALAVGRLIFQSRCLWTHEDDRARKNVGGGRLPCGHASSVGRPADTRVRCCRLDSCVTPRVVGKHMCSEFRGRLPRERLGDGRPNRTGLLRIAVRDECTEILPCIPTFRRNYCATRCGRLKRDKARCLKPGREDMYRGAPVELDEFDLRHSRHEVYVATGCSPAFSGVTPVVRMLVADDGQRNLAVPELLDQSELVLVRLESPNT
jgi:hypothetical protein